MGFNVSATYYPPNKYQNKIYVLSTLRKKKYVNLQYLQSQISGFISNTGFSLSGLMQTCQVFKCCIKINKSATVTIVREINIKE